MRIALLAPLISAIAPPFLGGSQALLADLAIGLAARGHDVTLYAADGSDVPGVRLVQLGIDPATLRPARFMETPADRLLDTPPVSEDDDDLARSTEAFLRAYRVIAAHASEHDLVHAHAYDWPALVLASLQPLPVVHTLHLPAVDTRINRALATLAPRTTHTPTRIVTVSHACAATYASTCRIDAVIYNGIETSRIPF
ncbi:MAG: glycosyltransferase, partial [Ktedonobacterales bacterium]